MRVGARLYTALVPAVLGLVLVAALAYWGQYAYRVPVTVVVVATIAATASLIVAWRNTQIVTRRIEMLAGREDRVGTLDELASIERTVERLRSDLSAERANAAAREAELARERGEAMRMLEQVAGATVRAIDDVRLPLHILLDNRFGELNDNQEEMLGAAQTAVDDAAQLLHRTRTLLALDRGTIAPRRDAVHINDLLGALLKPVRADAERRRIELVVDIPPALPRVLSDRTHLQEALAALFRSALGRTADEGRCEVAALPTQPGVRISVAPGTAQDADLDALLAFHLLRTLGVTVRHEPGRLTLDLPTASPRASR